MLENITKTRLAMLALHNERTMLLEMMLIGNLIHVWRNGNDCPN